MKIKSQKGSITIFVLIALLFYTAFLLLMYAANTNKFKTITEKSDILKGIYEKNTSEESINNIYNKKNTEQLIAGIEKISLPAEYQQVAYLESTGQEYINTDFYTTNNTKINLIMQLKSIDGDQKFLGSYGSGGICLGVLDQKWRIGGNTWGGRNTNGICNIVTNNQKTNIIAYQNSWIINEEEITSTNSISNNNQAPIAVFGVFYNLYIFQKNAIRVYNLKIYNNENIERNFIPCYCTTKVTDVKEIECASGTKGLYDLVNNVFYTNQGTGEVVVGPDID